MKPTFRRTALIAGLALVVLVPVLVLAQTQGPPPQRPGMMGGRGMMAGRQGGPGQGMMFLNLTDQQRTQVQAVMEQHRQATQDSAKQMADLQQQLKDAIFADAGPNDAAIAQVKGQIAVLETQLQAGRIDAEKQIAAILTLDQRKLVRDMPGAGLLGGPGPGRGRGPGRGMHGFGW
jgi:Spy/CpxP family protein refolding chaperone